MEEEDKRVQVDLTEQYGGWKLKHPDETQEIFRAYVRKWVSEKVKR